MPSRTVNCPRQSRQTDARCSLALRNRPWPESSATLSSLLRDVVQAISSPSSSMRSVALWPRPVYLTIETLILMDFHSTVAVRRHWHIYHSVNRLTLSKIHPLVPSGWSVLVFQTSWRVDTRSKPRVWGTFDISVPAGCWCLLLSHNWDGDDLANVRRCSARLNHLSCITTSFR